MNIRNKLELTKEAAKQGIQIKGDHVSQIIDTLIRAMDLIEDLDSQYWNANDDENYKYFSRSLGALNTNEFTEGRQNEEV